MTVTDKRYQEKQDQDQEWQWDLLWIGIVMGLLFLGCAVFVVLFLSMGKRSYGITACGYGIAAMIIPVIMQCVNLKSDDYIQLAAIGALTVITTHWALLRSKKYMQERDESVKVCASLKGAQPDPGAGAVCAFHCGRRSFTDLCAERRTGLRRVKRLPRQVNWGEIVQ